MITRVTASKATGITATITRRTTLEATARGEDSHTMRKSGGALCNALIRSRHFGTGSTQFRLGVMLISLSTPEARLQLLSISPVGTAQRPAGVSNQSLGNLVWAAKSTERGV